MDHEPLARDRAPQRAEDGDGGHPPPPRLLLPLLLAAPFMANVDTAITNVAAPSVRADLGASGGEAGLVVSGYVIAYAVLLVTGARLGALHGRRKVFVTGMAVFTAASLGCALAPDPVTLVVTRFVQGGGAALMVPQVLSGIQLHYTGRRRIRAIGYYSAALSGGAVAGQALGGLLVAADLFGTGWRPAFLINVPVGLLLIAATVRLMPADAGERGAAGADVKGMALLSAAVLALVVPLLLGRDQGWPAWTWVSLAASVPVFAAFGSGQVRLANRGGRPLVAPAVVREPAVRRSLLAHGATTLTYFALLFVMAVYLQDGLGRGPAYTGCAMLSWVAAFGLAGALLSGLPERYRAVLPVAGCLLLAAGYAAVLAYVLAGGRSGPGLFAVLAVGGFGLGTSNNSLIARMTESVPTRLAADLSGVITTNAQLSAALGVPLLGSCYLALAGRQAGAAGAAHALAAVAGVCAALCLSAALAARAPGSAGGADRPGSGGIRPPGRAIGGKSPERPARPTVSSSRPGQDRAWSK